MVKRKISTRLIVRTSCFRRWFVEWESDQGPSRDHSPFLKPVDRTGLVRGVNGPVLSHIKPNPPTKSTLQPPPTEDTKSWLARPSKTLIPRRFSSCSSSSTASVPENLMPRSLYYPTLSFTNCGQHLWPMHHARKPNTRHFWTPIQTGR